MAPIQNKSSSSSSSSSSYSVHKSSSNQEQPRRSRESTADSVWDSFLPVTRRGRFFQDSIFENTRTSFDDAVRDALSRWGDDSDFLSDSWHDSGSSRLSNLSRYRQMRSRTADEDDVAITVTSDNNTHKIVLDVHDFVEGDLKVRVVGERDLLVEGRREKKVGGASSVSTQKFSRSFNLPEGTDVNAIDSVMSSDGILTITAPKVQGRLGGSKSHSESKSSFADSKSRSPDTREPCDCDKCYPKLKTRENVFHPHIEKTQSSTNADDKGCRVRSEQRENMSDSSKNANSYCHEEKKKSSSSNMEGSCRRSSSDKMDVPIKAFFNSRPITRKGRFFDDSFFEDTRGDYRSAIQDILSKWGERSSNTDDMTSYRNLRTRDLRDDNQAARSIEDEFQHKFIVDVHDFMKDGEINVKAVDDKELVVEGNVQKSEGGSKSIKRFSRRFLLPDDVHLESVSSVMSSDGVLTIIAPKKNAVRNMKEIHTPASTQKIEQNTEAYEKTSSESNMQTSNENKVYEKLSMMNENCNNEVEYEDCGMRASSVCSQELESNSACQAGGKEEEEQSNLYSSVSSKTYKAETSEETNVSGGRNISILVDTAEEEEKDIDKENNRHMSERSMEDIESDRRGTRDALTEDLTFDQISVRGKSAENMDIDQRNSRGRSTDDFDTNVKSVREKSNASRERYAESLKFDKDFDMEEEDDINFQESSRHRDVSDKKLCSILKTPDRFYQEDKERDSRERSYIDEELVAADRGTPDRGTPSRDNKIKATYTPLNPDAKRSLPISRRGHFCSDAFFNDFQDSFKTAVSDVLIKFNEKFDKTDDITAYRNLRLRDPKLENQAFHVQEDQGAHKVVLDVKDFLLGEIEAAVYGERELVVEGKVARQMGTSITTLSFLRRFSLPENVDTDAIAAVMSSDGILTVVTPWKGFSGLSAIKNILSEEDKPVFDRFSDFDRRWDNSNWDSSRDDEDFMTPSLNSRRRSRLRQTEDDYF